MVVIKLLVFVIFTIVNIKGRTLPGRIIGGKTAPDGNYPYMVSIQLEDTGHWCGGAIISKRTILTAGHCLLDVEPSEIAVLAGTNDLTEGGTMYLASELKVHEKFLKPGSGRGYDIGLVILKEPIQYTDIIKPAVLPETDTQPGASVVLTGWGTTTFPEENQPIHLQYIDLTVVSNEKCSSDHPDTEIFPSNICTLTEKGEGSCHGDSGGPLIENGSVVVGTVSWGDPCAVGTADVYSRVFSYVDWIREHGIPDS